MSGHNKWSTIKRKKGAMDAQRGKLFARLIRGIEAAAKTGGADPESNPTLADAIQKAKDNDVPKDNIERALRRATGAEGGAVDYETVYFEGYAPNGVAVYVECLTDNRNRATMEVRGSFKKHGGSLAEPGAVDYLFSRRGVLIVPAQDLTEDDLLLAGLDAGISDVRQDEASYTVITEPSDLMAVRAAFEEAGIPVDSSEVTLLPIVNVPVTDEDEAKRVLRLIDTLEESADVQQVYANFDIPERVLEAVA